jgi:hypothetical protein
MVEAGILRRHCRRSGPGDCVHPIAVANPSKLEKLSMVGVETCTPDNIIAARKGGTMFESWRVIAYEMEIDPADWPCRIEVGLRSRRGGFVRSHTP